MVLSVEDNAPSSGQIMLDHKTSLNKFKMTEIMLSTFYD